MRHRGYYRGVCDGDTYAGPARHGRLRKLAVITMTPINLILSVPTANRGSLWVLSFFFLHITELKLAVQGQVAMLSGYVFVPTVELGDKQ